MDSLGKAFKAGLVKAYAAGQQQVQQRVAKLAEQSNSSGSPQQPGYGPPQPSGYAPQQHSGYAPHQPSGYGHGQHDASYYHGTPGHAQPPGYASPPSATTYSAPANANASPYFPPPPTQAANLNQATSTPSPYHGYAPSPPGPASGAQATTYESCPIPAEYPRPSSFQQSAQPPAQSAPPSQPHHQYTSHGPSQHSSYAPPPPAPYVAPNHSQQQAYDHGASATGHSYAAHNPQGMTYTSPPPPTTSTESYSSPPQIATPNAQGADYPYPLSQDHAGQVPPRRRPVPTDQPPQPDSHLPNNAPQSVQFQHPPPPPPPQPLFQPAPAPYVPEVPTSYQAAPNDFHTSLTTQASYSVNNPKDITEGLSAGMNKLNVNGDPRQSEYSAVPPAVPVAQRARRVLEMKSEGEPSDTLRYCPEGRMMDYSLDWYHLEGLPTYLVCTRCHADHIKGTSLAANFIRVKRPDGSSSGCGFYYSRITDVLWPLSLKSNSTEALRAFMVKRLELPACKGAGNVVTAADGFKWFGMAAKEHEGFITCEACYEDTVVGTSFESRFASYQEQGADDKWSCDLCVPYIRRAASHFSQRNDWQGFVGATTKRMQLPACEGKDVELNSITWYLPRRNIDNFHVCELCYLDKVALTDFEDEFDPQAPKSGFDSWLDTLGKRRTCDLASTNRPIAFALETSLFLNDFDLFARSAAKIAGLVPCTANGIIRGNWWTISGGCPDFSVCEACHTGILQANDLERYFEAAPRDKEATIVCSLCAASPRCQQYLVQLVKSIDTGVFGHFTDFVRKFAGVQPCAGIKSREKGKWWGYQEALFCENCYVGFVADTSLGGELPLNGEYDERAQICQVWSPRMRTMWLKTCEAGPPGSAESKAALDEFKAFGSHRLQVWLQTVPKIEYMNSMRQMRIMNAMHQGQLSLMYSGMNSMAVLSGTTDGNLHGNSSLGWYETEHGATGAQMFNNMQAGMTSGGGEWAQILHLSQMWTEVE
ncbi:alpha-amylase [Purpureocillium lavendulum]|uniref:Alpha-amylase n=1 Tax=Purpureocillium lavendulum TaxID=1247861 RepID=A0AB34G6R9_9HYPO|nr:alpha-amylase [Purpureocillium lavendulum]